MILNGKTPIRDGVIALLTNMSSADILRTCLVEGIKGIPMDNCQCLVAKLLERKFGIVFGITSCNIVFIDHTADNPILDSSIGLHSFPQVVYVIKLFDAGFLPSLIEG